MNSKIYMPLFWDHEVQQYNCNIFWVKDYDELISLLVNKNITNEDEYCKLVKMYTTMVSLDMIPTLESYNPEIKKKFFQTPKDNVLKDIAENKLYKNDEYLQLNFKYTKIDKLTIDHISFLFLEDWNDKYQKMTDIISKISDEISDLQSYFLDDTSKNKIVKSYITHLMTFMTKCLSSLFLWKLETLSKEEYVILNNNITAYQLRNNDFISQVLNDNTIVYQIDRSTRILLIDALEIYQNLMIRKYHQILSYISNDWEINIDELPNLLMYMIQNQYVIDLLR